jgi:hypothetical protein
VLDKTDAMWWALSQPELADAQHWTLYLEVDSRDAFDAAMCARQAAGLALSNQFSLGVFNTHCDISPPRQVVPAHTRLEFVTVQVECDDWKAWVLAAANAADTATLPDDVDWWMPVVTSGLPSPTKSLEVCIGDGDARLAMLADSTFAVNTERVTFGFLGLLLHKSTNDDTMQAIADALRGWVVARHRLRSVILDLRPDFPIGKLSSV